MDGSNIAELINRLIDKKFEELLDEDKSYKGYDHIRSFDIENDLARAIDEALASK